MERPGRRLIAELGGLHRFMDWPGHLLTDSGGYQVFSLEPKVTEEDARFRSVYDGSYVDSSPERSVSVQEQLGSRHRHGARRRASTPVHPGPCRPDALERTLRWAERSKAAHTRTDQAQFGIVQGGIDLEFREQSAERTVEIGFDGYAVGGLSVGESRDEMIPALARLPWPTCRPTSRATSWVSVIRSAWSKRLPTASTCSTASCPTRLARHGTALTSEGRINLKNLRFASDDGPIDPGFRHDLSGRYSRAYVRHLLVTNEPTAGRIITLHNLACLGRPHRPDARRHRERDLRRPPRRDLEYLGSALTRVCRFAPCHRFGRPSR